EFSSMYEEQLNPAHGADVSQQTADFYYEHTMDSVWNVTFSKLDDRCWVLLTYDLIKRNPINATLSIHRLVQNTVRNRMTNEIRIIAFRVLINLLYHVYPRQQLGMAMEHAWDDCELFLPQVLVVASHFLRLRDADLETKQFVEVLHNATWYMQEKGMFEQLLPLAETTKAIIAATDQGESLLMGEIYNTLGNVHLEIGNLEECEENFKRVRDIRVKHCAPDDPSIANINNNLSLAETALERYETAVQLSYKTIKIRENLEDEQYSTYKKKTLPINYSNLCRILYTMGKLDEAADKGNHALELAKNTFGLKSKNTAQAMYNLADVHMKRGDESALHLHLQALGIRKDVLGSHYQTAGSCYKVACLLYTQGDAQGSQQLLSEALAMYEHAYSAQGGAARTMFKLAEVLTQQGLVDEANKLSLRAKELRQKLRMTKLPLLISRETRIYCCIDMSADAQIPLIYDNVKSTTSFTFKETSPRLITVINLTDIGSNLLSLETTILTLIQNDDVMSADFLDEIIIQYAEQELGEVHTKVDSCQVMGRTYPVRWAAIPKSQWLTSAPYALSSRGVKKNDRRKFEVQFKRAAALG
ncbi:MAG: hypothetical protein Q9214_003963, partial [Letrouitia sp. 1 TL-2023]